MGSRRPQVTKSNVRGGESMTSWILRSDEALTDMRKNLATAPGAHSQEPTMILPQIQGWLLLHPLRLPLLLLHLPVASVQDPVAGHHGWMRRGRRRECSASQGATPASHAQAGAAVDRDGTGYGDSPLFPGGHQERRPTGTEALLEVARRRRRQSRPFLATLALADSTAEGLDPAALSILVRCVLKVEERKKKEVRRQEDQEEALLTKLQAERDALTATGLGTFSSQLRKRLNGILDEREAILDKRERRRVVAASSSHPRMEKRRRKKKRLWTRRSRRRRCLFSCSS